MNNTIVATQARLPADMHEFLKREADKLGVAQNAFMIFMIAQGRKMWEADITHHLNLKSE